MNTSRIRFSISKEISRYYWRKLSSDGAKYTGKRWRVETEGNEAGETQRDSSDHDVIPAKASCMYRSFKVWSN